MRRRSLLVALFLACAGCASPDASGVPTVDSELEVGGGTILLRVEPGALALDRTALEAWVTSAARAVAGYYGAFPVKRALVRIRPVEGGGVMNGVATGDPEPAVTLDLGRDATATDLANDWMLTHELIHLAFPSVPPRHHWIEEGIATYVEPIARVRVGTLAAGSFWHDFVRDLPQGEPEADDKGLDNTPTWGRTYWGGALFCFVADLRIRAATRESKGLEDALRGIVAAGGSISVEWSLERALAAGDAATRTHVLVGLYDEWKEKRVTVDLAALWKELGVTVAGDSVRFDDTAPRAATRRALTA
ncbi:MAG TPA: hypothetical protein VFF73_14060, partial [Planctomycetota bacterium]|nr:hypothetical protein [Planctomycetota bacterium]